ncbi:MAG TPA: MFS transporter [Casimicrobiaceae bacterium]|nr:MFS transporter [Casimicrobiaceae bacterium]
MWSPRAQKCSTRKRLIAHARSATIVARTYELGRQAGVRPEGESRADAPHAVARDAGSGMTSRDAFLRVFPGVMVAMFLAAADQTILASALPTIASSLGGLADLSWVIVGYLIAATVAAPLYGHLGDRFGRRRMLLGALALFTVASAACALAQTLLALIIARTVQGLGGGGLMTLAQALIGEHVSPRERGRFSGYFATVFALASTSGPILGAYLTEHVSWRAVFAINLPLGLLAATLALRMPHAAPPQRERFQPDIVGAMLFCSATVAFLFTLSSAGHRFAWTSPFAFLLLGGAVAGYALLAIWERRAAEPVIPVRFLAVPAIARSDAVVVCFAAALFSTVLYLPLYLQLGRGLRIGQSGMLLLPITLSAVATSTVVGQLITRTGRVKVFPQVGLGLATLAFSSLAASIAIAPTTVLLVMTALVGVGLGMVMPPTQVSVQLAAGRESLGAATASISLSRSIGGALGVALTGSVLFAALGDAALSALLRELIEGGGAAIGRLSAQQRGLLAAHLDAAYRIVFAILALITTVGALLASTVPKPDWDRRA